MRRGAPRPRRSRAGPRSVQGASGKESFVEIARRVEERAEASGNDWPEDLPMGPKVRCTRFKTANGAEFKDDGTQRVRSAQIERINRDGGKMTEKCKMGFLVIESAKPLGGGRSGRIDGETDRVGERPELHK